MLYLAIFVSGLAGLTWEVLWIHHAGLALGVSAQGSAITFASIMLGMAVGSVLAGRALGRWPRLEPLAGYAALELAIGVCGAALPQGFESLASIDVAVWRASPALAPVVHLGGILLVLGAPSVAMGASLPLFSRLASRDGSSLARLYAVHVAGAALGTLSCALWLIPSLGIELTGALASASNVAIAGLFFVAARRRSRQAGATATEVSAGEPVSAEAVGCTQATWTAFTTGFVTFALEVAWFRSLRAAFQATTESAALVLGSALLGLALGARLAPWLRRRLTGHLELVLLAAGVLVLAASPVVERFDLFVPTGGDSYLAFSARRFGAAAALLVPCFLALGVGLPWLFDSLSDARQVARLYAVNTAGSVAGSIGAAWVLLPSIGAVRAGWIAGGLLVALAAAFARGRVRVLAGVLGVASLALAVAAGSGAGRLRMQIDADRLRPTRLLDVKESADSTVTTAELDGGMRVLVIDGFVASGDAKTAHYMPWMGRLPMLMHEKPEQALVICFGTGQTANAVRRERPVHLDIAEINPAVLDFAKDFPVNEGVLDDPSVTAHVMDGRAWLRRTTTRYDVVTLEPMPPTFAGSNALYSLEFYELIKAKSRPDARVAQWLPFHLVTPRESASIVRTFVTAFPEAWLWIDLESRTGVLLGRVGEPRDRPPDERWPGLARGGTGRDLTDEQVRHNQLFGPEVLARYAERGELITDDNQRLSYGFGRLKGFDGLGKGELDVLRALAAVR